MANQCDFVETQLSASVQFGSNCCPGGPYFASLDVLCRTLMIMIKIMLLEFILILFFVIIRATTFSALKIGHIFENI